MGTETTITKLEAQTYQGKPNGFKVTMADGTEGYLQKESDDNLREGDKVIAEYKDYTSKAGNKSVLVTLKRVQYASPQAEQSGYKTQTVFGIPPERPAINVGVGKSKKEMKAMASIEIAVKLIELLKNGKLESAQLAVELREWDVLVWSEIDEAYSGK